MNLKRAKDKGVLGKWATYFGMPIFWVGLILDIFVNIFICSSLFLDLPKEFTVTDRLERYLREDSWRRKVAVWFCNEFLNELDPSGKHCR